MYQLARTPPPPRPRTLFQSFPGDGEGSPRRGGPPGAWHHALSRALHRGDTPCSIHRALHRANALHLLAAVTHLALALLERRVQLVRLSAPPGGREVRTSGVGPACGITTFYGREPSKSATPLECRESRHPLPVTPLWGKPRKRGLMPPRWPTSRAASPLGLHHLPL